MINQPNPQPNRSFNNVRKPRFQPRSDFAKSAPTGTFQNKPFNASAAAKPSITSATNKSFATPAAAKPFAATKTFVAPPFKSAPLAGALKSTSEVGASAPVSSIPTASTAPNQHRIVLGKGIRKHPEVLRHIAGARMNVMRKESRGGGRRPGPSRPLTHTKGEDVIPALAADSIRIIPLGGVEEIGRNMTAIEYGNDIVVIDIGFQFKDENTPGIDYILPNTKYLEERQSKIRAVFITHGHLDHIGGIPYIMPRIGNPPLYTRLLTSVLIQKRQEEFQHVPKLDIKVVEKEETITVGNLKVKFFAVTHTIPDAMGIIVQTPYGAIVHTGDLKLDHVDSIPTAEEEAEYTRAFPIITEVGPRGPWRSDLGNSGTPTGVLMLMADSTNVEIPGFSIPEKHNHQMQSC